MDNTGETLKEIVIIYHGKCRDGFGAAYAAWKKFGDTASYLPVTERGTPPEGLTDKEIYIIDYSYPKDVLQQLEDTNKSVMVIDHHLSAEKDVTSFPGNIFDMDHSGCVLAWKYFHPDTEVPEFLLQVEDHDLWRFAQPDNRDYNTAIGLYPTTFAAWDLMIESLKEDGERAKFIAKGNLVARFEDKLVNGILEFKERVVFEGHEVWAVNADRTYRSILGNRLAGYNLKDNQIALGIVYSRYDGKVHISLRSHGDVDVAAMAGKYGGGGHKNAAAFNVASFGDLPFVAA